MPSAPELIDPDGGLWNALAYELRFQREKADISQEAVGRIALTSRKTIQNWEAGRYHPSVEALRLLDAAWVTGGLLTRLHRYAQVTAPPPGWYEDYLTIEQRATQLKIYQGQVVPALFQTEAYMRAAFRDAGAADIDGTVRERMERQDAVLRRSAPPWVMALLDECVLRRHAGGPDVMRDQFGALLEIGELRHVIMRVIPDKAGTHPGLDGSFTYVTTDAFDLVLVASPDVDQRLVRDRGALARYQVRYEQISAKAATPLESQGMIRHWMSEFT